MNTLPNHIETDEEFAPQSDISLTTKVVISALLALGVLDTYEDYAEYSKVKSSIIEVQKK